MPICAMATADGRPSGQRWGTFLRNHLPQIAAMDLFVVPTIGFNLLYVLVVVRLARRELVWINVTAYPTAEWIARQITEAFARMPMARNRRVDLGCGDRATFACSARFRQASHRAPVPR
jgi:hypothetical protein